MRVAHDFKIYLKLVVRENRLRFRLLAAQEAAHALDLVVGLEAVAEQLFLDLNGLLNGQADAAVDGLLAVADRNGSILGDLAGQLQRSGHQLLLRVDGVDQTNAQGLVCLDVQGRVDELLGHAHADKACQTLGAAEARRDA